MGILWKVGAEPKPVERADMESELALEDMLVANLRILSPNWMLIGRQITTGTGYLDILAVSRDGALVVIELKKSKASRDVVSQILDYVSWVSALPSETINDIYRTKTGHDLGKAFKDYFGFDLDPDLLNAQQMAIIVASLPDPPTARIVSYLAQAGVPINLNTFEVFLDGDQRYLSPHWTVDPAIAEINIEPNSGPKEPWNGHYYCGFGSSETGRNWEDARTYGFFSAGGGNWYSTSLQTLGEGDLIWVLAPNVGYVGVGRVLAARQPYEDFVVQVDGKDAYLKDLELLGDYTHPHSADDDTREFFVPVEWLHTVALDEGVKQVGFFGNQHTVCRPKASKWSHTVNSLKAIWGINLPS